MRKNSHGGNAHANAKHADQDDDDRISSSNKNINRLQSSSHLITKTSPTSTSETLYHKFKTIEHNKQKQILQQQLRQ